jgi:hypothetical protein
MICEFSDDEVHIQYVLNYHLLNAAIAATITTAATNTVANTANIKHARNVYGDESYMVCFDDGLTP